MDQPHTGIGTALRSARERRQLSLESISRGTHIAREYLEAIDEDRLESLPRGAYAKGFIRAYASYLGLDPAPFVRTYDERFGRQRLAAAVVRHPVRVPHAAQPRTWRMAAGAGLAVIVLLGIVGVARSGEKPASPPRPAAADLASASGTQATDVVDNPAGAVVRVDVIGQEVWVQGAPDDRVEFDGLLEHGRSMVFRGQDSVRLSVGNASAVRLRVNGRDVGTPPGSVFTTIVTPRTRGMPPPVPGS